MISEGLFDNEDWLKKFSFAITGTNSILKYEKLYFTKKCTENPEMNHIQLDK